MNMETITFKVGGMSCMGCVNSVKRVLEPMTGVARVDVNLATGTATIDFEPTRVGADALRHAIVNAGYPVTD